MIAPARHLVAALPWIAGLLAAACGGGAGSEPPPRGRTATHVAPPALLCVVRHAEAFKNLEPPPAGLGPDALDRLTPHGEDQARGLRAELPAGVALVWSSPANRALETAALLGLEATAEVTPALRPLDGEVGWAERTRAWASGDDPRPPGGESLADGRDRVVALLGEARARLGPGRHAVLVTHGDVASLVLGELRGTPLLERPARDTLGTGEARCLPLPASAPLSDVDRSGG